MAAYVNSDNAAGVTTATQEDNETHSNDSKRSDNTLWDEAEDAAKDDLVDTTVGESKQTTLFLKLENYIVERYGQKGDPSRPKVTVPQLIEHNGRDDFWVVVDGKVFDLGPFLRGEANHPGGRSILARQLELGGQDAAERFVRWHHPSGNTARRAPDYFMGDLQGNCPGHDMLAALSVEVHASNLPQWQHQPAAAV
eukprot:CAMPEP_0172853616 /NCGR_PEP_ID=MMETSP1075-20121228/57244_1 /TAXON_ID=2916 /ORGANISM="Ceratium fusus, Strain PA161109" /LENGTH=195 /DNA_ID=CAMNT_0013700133 /DNA_START=71 /DNA_END=656 /DNA_ORIENTATION=-